MLLTRWPHSWKGGGGEGELGSLGAYKVSNKVPCFAYHERARSIKWFFDCQFCNIVVAMGHQEFTEEIGRVVEPTGTQTGVRWRSVVVSVRLWPNIEVISAVQDKWWVKKLISYPLNRRFTKNNRSLEATNILISRCYLLPKKIVG